MQFQWGEFTAVPVGRIHGEKGEVALDAEWG